MKISPFQKLQSTIDFKGFRNGSIQTWSVANISLYKNRPQTTSKQKKNYSCLLAPYVNQNSGLYCHLTISICHHIDQGASPMKRILILLVPIALIFACTDTKSKMKTTKYSSTRSRMSRILRNFNRQDCLTSLTENQPRQPSNSISSSMTGGSRKISRNPGTPAN